MSVLQESTMSVLQHRTRFGNHTILTRRRGKNRTIRQVSPVWANVVFATVRPIWAKYTKHQFGRHVPSQPVRSRPQIVIDGEAFRVCPCRFHPYAPTFRTYRLNGVRNNRHVFFVGMSTRGPACDCSKGMTAWFGADLDGARHCSCPHIRALQDSGFLRKPPVSPDRA